MNRINDFITVDKKEISMLFAAFDRTLSVLDFSLMKDSIAIQAIWSQQPRANIF